MILEAKQQYRGVLCLRCHQPIPLSPFAAAKNVVSEKRESSSRDEFAVRSFTVSSFTLRCRVCEGEGPYTALEVIDCDGTPKAAHFAGTPTPADLSDLTTIEAIGPTG